MAARYYGDFWQDKLVLPQKVRYKNPKDHKCAWVLWGVSSVWLGVLLVTHTRNFLRDLNSHDSVDTTFSTVPLRSPNLHICHYNSSLLDLVSVRAFVISGDEERYVRARRSMFENCAEFIPEDRKLTLGDTVYYDATWTCPVRRYLELQLQRYALFYEGTGAKLALQSPAEFATSFRDGPGLRGSGGEMFCEMGKRLWTSNVMGKDWKHANQAATVPRHALALLDKWVRLIRLGNKRESAIFRGVGYEMTPSKLGCFGDFLSFSDAFANQTEKTEVEQLTAEVLDVLKRAVNDEAAIAWFGSHMSDKYWVGVVPSKIQSYEQHCHIHFLQDAKVLSPAMRHASGFQFRFSLANYTDDKFAIRQEMTSPMRFGIHLSSDLKPKYFRSKFHVSGVARTWRWLDSFGGRWGADHADTDYLECFSMAGGAVTDAAKDEESDNRLMGHGAFDAPVILVGDTFAGTRMAFTYMSGTLKEELFRNSIDMDCVKFMTGLLALGWVLALSEKCLFKTFSPKHPKHFRWNVLGLGRYRQPASDDVEMSALTQAESDALEAMEAMREAQGELQRCRSTISADRARTLGGHAPISGSVSSK